MSNGRSSWPSVCWENERKVQSTPRMQARTDTLTVTLRQERQDQEMTALCLQGPPPRERSGRSAPDAECGQKPAPAAVRTPNASKKKYQDQGRLSEDASRSRACHTAKRLAAGKNVLCAGAPGTLLRSRKLEQRLPVRKVGPLAAPPRETATRYRARKQLHQVSGQTGGSRVQPRPHGEVSRQAMGSTAKTAVKERGVPVKSAGHPFAKRLGSESRVGNRL
mgnify:CR=1 FL=1